ncbi:FtsX-like permease family protein [Nocardioides sp.]|uniref:FtsX-like permease family protein n=1 Tax=Nocardioides sp. TaxID=35761 RepID=UPI003516E52E
MAERSAAPRTGRSLGIVWWVAARGLVAERAETTIRLVVGVVAVLVALAGAAMHPTALVRSQHTAAGLLPVAPPEAHSAGVLVVQTDDYYRRDPIRVRTTALVGAPVADARLQLRMPPVGGLITSPRMRRLLGTDPVLARRYPGPVVGVVADDGLRGPRELVVWRTVPPEQMPADAGWFDPAAARSSGDIATLVPTELRFASSMLIVGFLVPLLALLGVVGTLGAARRERRLASMRLVGMTDREARASAALSAALAAALSAVAAWACFELLVPVVAPRLPVEAGVWPDDVRLPVVALVVVLVAFPLLAAAATWLGLRSLVTSPLGVERRSRAARARRWPAVLLSAGAVVLGLLVTGTVEDRVVRSNLALLAAVLLMVGLVATLPPLAALAARLLARRTSGLGSLVAARSIIVDPARATRSAVGLSLLVCAAGPLLVFFPLIADTASSDLSRLGRLVGDDTLLATTAPLDGPRPAAGVPAAGPSGRAPAHAVTEDAARDDAIAAAVSIDLVPLQSTAGEPSELIVGVVDCDRLETITRIPATSCAGGLAVAPQRLQGTYAAYRESSIGDDGRIVRTPLGEPVTLDIAPTTSRRLEVLYDGLAVSPGLLLPRSALGPTLPTGGFARLTLARPRPGMLEEARTRLARASDGEALSIGEKYAIATRTTRDFRAITAGAGLLVVVIAALTTAVTAHEQVRRGEPERRLLWVSGADGAVARRTVLVQTLVPAMLALAPAVAISLGLTFELVTLLETARVSVPVGAVLTVAALGLAVTAMAGQAVVRLTPPVGIAPTE